MTDKAMNIKQCEYCNKRGHEEKECWTKDRQNKPNHNKGKNGNRDCFFVGLRDILWLTVNKGKLT